MKQQKTDRDLVGLNHSRREFLKASAMSVAMLAVGIEGSTSFAADDTFPSKPIDIIVPFSVGGGTDIWMRTFSVALVSRKNLGVAVNIRNLPGASSLKGTAEAFNAKPDGYTLISFNPPSTPWSWYIHQPAFDITQLTGIGVYIREPAVIVVRADYEYQDFEALFKAYEQGKIKDIASNAIGTGWHVTSLLLNKRIGLNWKKYIPFKGSGDVISALERNIIDVGIVTAAACLAPVSEGKLHPVAVIGLEQRLQSFPQTPTLYELGQDPLKETVLRRSIFAPPGLPGEIQAKFETAFTKAQEDPLVQARFKDLELEPAYGTGEEAHQAILDSLKVAEEINLRELMK